MKPLLSIIIPALNEQTTLPACLTSLLAQDYPPSKYEIIVVDNASTDNTAQVAKAFAVKVVSEPIRSVVHARRTGVLHSQGKIIVTADADTLYPPDWLKKISVHFTHNTSLIALCGWVDYAGMPVWFNLLNNLNRSINSLCFRLTGNLVWVFAANLAFKKAALQKIGGYPLHLPELGDQQYLFSRFKRLGDLSFLPSLTCLTSPRKHRGNIFKIIYHNGWYRITGFIINRFFHRQIIGPAPAIREPSPKP